MSKVKIKRHSPELDMTPMVDLAFLLVTFFMLTTQFAPEEPVAVDMPSSVADFKLPDRDIFLITIAGDGRVFFNVDGKFTREALIKTIGERYSIPFTDREIKAFSIPNSYGVPVSQLKQFLALPADKRKTFRQEGIPVDSTNNELANWLNFARSHNPKIRIAIKGDGDASYTTVKKVIGTLQDNNATIFNLITSLEERPKKL